MRGRHELRDWLGRNAVRGGRAFRGRPRALSRPCRIGRMSATDPFVARARLPLADGVLHIPSVRPLRAPTGPA